MQVNKLTYKDICAHAEDAYRTLFDRKEWPPASHSRLKGSTSCIRKHGDSITRAEVLNLIQSRPPTMVLDLPRKESVTSATSLDTGRECPENNKGKGRNGNGNERPKDVKSWKSTPPPSGAPQVKQANGKAFNWCKLQALDYYTRNGNAHWRQEEL
ncbi:hypothetical protein MHU86_25585 [Fragilaria crotonensis]|nr:hypothetical protein MHU86_25585 [Fragilaria crotonensis]